MGNMALMGTSLGVAVLAICGLCLLIPDWVRERIRAAQLTDRLAESQRLLAQTQAQLETTRQALIRCREQVIARNLDELKKRDPVDTANDAIAAMKRGAGET